MNYDNLSKERIISIHKDTLECVERQQKEIEILKENNENMQIEMANCWEKIDKAIEYINKLPTSINISNQTLVAIATIEKILKGEDNE